LDTANLSKRDRVPRGRPGNKSLSAQSDFFLLQGASGILLQGPLVRPAEALCEDSIGRGARKKNETGQPRNDVNSQPVAVTASTSA
jgi:hypothetical protein